MPLQLTDLTPEKEDWRYVFLKKLAETSCVTSACIAAGVSREWAYRCRKRFPRFRAKWQEAIDISVEALELMARNRAFDKADPGSTALTIFLLKAHKPETYRETFRQVVSGDPDAPLVISYVNDWRKVASDVRPADDPAPVPPPGPDRGEDESETV